MLINCPECNKEVSDTATQCVHCGKRLIPHGKRYCPKCELLMDFNNEICPRCGFTNKFKVVFVDDKHTNNNFNDKKSLLDIIENPIIQSILYILLFIGILYLLIYFFY